jgi:schlafen family protein
LDAALPINDFAKPNVSLARFVLSLAEGERMKILGDIGVIKADDIEDLKQRKIQERAQVEYKENLYPLNDHAKFELLKDVSAMANAEGGVIIYGARLDQTGAPSDFPAMEIKNIDELHNQIDQILNDNLDERIPGLRHAAISRDDGRYYYVIRIPPSYLAPHMITMPYNRPRFYVRVNTVNAPINARQIKDSALRIEYAQNRATNFISGRLARNARFPGPSCTFHMVPLYSERAAIDLTNPIITRSLASLGSGVTMHSVHGFFIKREHRSGRTHVLVTRNGAIERFESPIARPSPLGGTTPLIAGTALEQDIITFARSAAEHPVSGLAEPPVLIGVNLTGMTGIGMWGTDNFPLDQVFDEDVIAPEPIVLFDWENELDVALKELFDTISQSFGLHGSPNYGSDGRRIQGR